MLNNYLVSMGVHPADGGSIAFEDGDQMSEAGRTAFQALYRHGIFKGVGGLRMDPEGTGLSCGGAELSGGLGMSGCGGS